VIIADTSGLLALYSRREPGHAGVKAVVDGELEPLVVSPYVVAELDYLVATRLGVDAELAVLAELAGGAYHLAAFGPEDLVRAHGVVSRYRDQDIGVADASIVVLADRHRTRSVLTLDHRHFEVLRPLDGGRFRLLPREQPEGDLRRP
jgi:predicted nucleic acid-binding protein